MNNVIDNQIDAVITWVDGLDPAHQHKVSSRLRRLGIPNFQLDPSRISSSGEIEYCILSILKYAPWLRKIYIVTDAQKPEILSHLSSTEYSEKIILVDHTVIFHDFEKYLPTFNSLSIETVLWRIPGLSEKFIYFNDDIFLLRKVSVNDFFDGNKIVVRGRWCKQYAYNIVKKLSCFFKLKHLPDAHRSLQERSAQLAGFKTEFLHLPHAPVALHKHTFENFFNSHPDLLKQNISYPIRDQNQFWAISLMQHIELKNNHAILNNKKTALMINGGFHSIKKQNQRLQKAIKNKNIIFLCAQGVEKMSLERQQYLWNWLKKIMS